MLKENLFPIKHHKILYLINIFFKNNTKLNPINIFA